MGLINGNYFRNIEYNPQYYKEWTKGSIRPIKEGHYVVITRNWDYGYHIEFMFFDLETNLWKDEESNTYDPYNYSVVTIEYYISIPIIKSEL